MLWERVGRAWSHTPAASREAYITQLMLDALDLTGDRDAALSRFARSVSAEEAEILLPDAPGDQNGLCGRAVPAASGMLSCK